MICYRLTISLLCSITLHGVVASWSLPPKLGSQDSQKTEYLAAQLTKQTAKKQAPSLSTTAPLPFDTPHTRPAEPLNKTAPTSSSSPPFSIDDYLPPSRLSQVPFPRNENISTISLKGFDGLVGQAEIMLLISSDGNVDHIIPLESTLPSFFVEEAITRFKETQFVPGTQGSMNVRSRIRIRLTPPTEDQLLGNPYSAKEKAWKKQ